MNDGSIQRRRGIVLSYLHKGLAMAVSLVYTPVMLRLLGQHEYGIYQAVSSVIAYLELLTFGCGAAFIRFFARCQAKEEEEGVASLNGFYLILYVCAGLLAVIISCAFALFSDKLFGGKLTQTEIQTASCLLILMGINTAIGFLNTVFATYVMARERFVWQNMLGIISTILLPCLSLPLLMAGRGSVGMGMAVTFLHLLTMLANAWYARHQQMRFSLRGIHGSLIREVSTFSFFLFVTSIAGVINSTIDKLLLAHMTGPSSVAVYDIGNKFNLYLMNFTVVIFGVFIPKVNQMVAKGASRHELTELMIRVGRVQFYIVAYIFGGFLLVGRYFIQLYAGKDYDYSYIIAVMLMSGCFIPYFQNLGIEIQKAQNRHYFRAICFLAIAIVNILVSIPLIHQYGVRGAAIGSFIALIVGNTITMNLYYYYGMHLEMKCFWIGMSRLIIVFLFIILLSGLGIFCLPITGIPMFCVHVLIYTIIYVSAMFVIACNESEKNYVNLLINKMLR